MNNNTLDQEELKVHLSISDFSEFNKVERLIKIFAWICILITGYFVFEQFNIAYINSQNPDKEFGFGFLLIIGGIFLMWLSLALPLIYISYWKKVKNYISDNNSTAFRKKSNLLLFLGVIAILSDLFWLLFGFMFLFLAFIGKETSFPIAVSLLFGLLLVAHNALQLWYYRKTLLINRDYRKLILD